MDVNWWIPSLIAASDVSVCSDAAGRRPSFKGGNLRQIRYSSELH